MNADDHVAVEATGNAAHFCKMIVHHVGKVVVITPWQFEVIRCSVKKMDKHDARAIALFLSKDMLPKARIKSNEHMQLSSLITTRDQLVKLRLSLIGKVHGMFVRHGLKVKLDILRSIAGFARDFSCYDLSPLDKAKLRVIENQIGYLRDNIKKLGKDITAFVQRLPGLKA